MNFNTFFKRINLPLIIIIPALLTLVFSIIFLIFYGDAASLFEYYVILFLFVNYCLFLWYYILYSYINLPRSKLSFVYFLLNHYILFSYIYSINMYIEGLSKPIYIHNLSSFSYYRYLFLCLLISFIFIYQIICFFNASLKANLNLFKNPYLQEEVRLLLHKLFSYSLGTICIKFLNNFHKSKMFRYFYLTLDFIFTHFYRVVLACLFVIFCFFKGDFRIILYLLPISFLIWLYSHLKFYILWFLKDNSSYINEVLEVSISYNLQDDVIVNLLDVQIKPENLVFKLSPYGYSKKYNVEDIPLLVPTWVQLASINSSLNRYNYLTFFFPYIFLFINFCCWFSIVSGLSIYLSNISLNTGGLFFSLFRRELILSRNLPIRESHEARMVHDQFAYQVQSLSSRQMTVGHTVYGEILPDGISFRIDGSLTHGNVKGKSLFLDLKGIPKIQEHIPFDRSLIVPITWLKTPISNPIPYLSRAHILAQLGPKSRTALVPAEGDKLPAIIPNSSTNESSS